jgi:hypothetical protein
MSLQPDTDRGLRRSAGQLRTIGARLLLAGGVVFAIGLVLMLATDGFGDFAGILLAALSTPPTLGGAALLISGLFARRAAEHKPFA